MTNMRYAHRLIRTAAVVIAAGIIFWPVVASSQEAVSFKNDVYPVLELRCIECHRAGGAGLTASGLDLTSYQGVMKGTRFGPVVLAGEPFVSNLVAVIERRTDAKLWMPHQRGKLSKCERLLIRFWIAQGARDN